MYLTAIVLIEDFNQFDCALFITIGNFAKSVFLEIDFNQLSCVVTLTNLSKTVFGSKHK